MRLTMGSHDAILLLLVCTVVVNPVFSAVVEALFRVS